MRYSRFREAGDHRLVEQSHRPVRRTLAMLGILPMTFYRWYARLQAGGPEALEDKPSRPGRVFRLLGQFRRCVVQISANGLSIAVIEPVSVLKQPARQRRFTCHSALDGLPLWPHVLSRLKRLR
jgi:hypothetical protein